MSRQILLLLISTLLAPTVRGKTETDVSSKGDECTDPVFCIQQHSTADLTLDLECFSSLTGKKTSGTRIRAPIHPGRDTGSWQRKADRPALAVRAADSDRILFVTVLSWNRRHYALLEMHITQTGDIEEFARLELQKMTPTKMERDPWVQQDNILSPTAIHGFADGRVLVGYSNRIVFADLRAGSQELLHEFTEGYRKHIDAFAWNGLDLLVAVDDTLSPKWMFVFNVEDSRRPRLLSTVDLPTGVNQLYEDAVFLNASLLVLLDNFGHMGAEGQTLHYLQLSASGESQVLSRVKEVRPRRQNGEQTLSGTWSWVRSLGRSGSGQLVLAAEDRGLMVLPGDEFEEERLRETARLIGTTYSTVDVRCRGKQVVALLSQPMDGDRPPFGPQYKKFSAAVFDEEWNSEVFDLGVEMHNRPRHEFVALV